MNKLLFLAMAAWSLTACSNERKPNEQITAAFHALHPNGVVQKWLDEPPNWEAKYTDGSEAGAVSFNAQGEVVETELVIAYAELPAAVLDHIRENYPAEHPQGAERITQRDGTVTYEVQVTGKELVFDAQGAFVEEEMD